MHDVPMPAEKSQVSVENMLDWLSAGLPRKRLILLVGVPACGKSTLSEGFEQRGFEVMSLDAIRKRVSGDEAVQDDLERVLQIFRSRLGQALSRGRAVVIDATNVYFEDRQTFLRQARRAGYTDITLLLLDTPLAECKRRNQLRERIVPEHALDRIYRELKGRGWPRTREGRLVVLKPGDAEGTCYFARLRAAR
jgi:protein phosphatase